MIKLFHTSTHLKQHVKFLQFIHAEGRFCHDGSDLGEHEVERTVRTVMFTYVEIEPVESPARDQGSEGLTVSVVRPSLTCVVCVWCVFVCGVCVVVCTTLRLVVSSMVWMTLSLCLKRICSMTSARREPNFYQGQRSGGDRPTGDEGRDKRERQTSFQRCGKHFIG